MWCVRGRSRLGLRRCARSLRRGHLTSADALELFRLLKARLLIPYHWGTFDHVTSGAFDAVNRLRRQLMHYPQREAVKLIEPGEVLEVTDD